jgi:hypothetical protein
MIQCGERGTGRIPGNGQTNTAPFIKNADIYPDNPTLGSRVSLRIDAGDKEGDAIAYEIRWFLNNQKLGEGLEFYLEEARRGDDIYVEIIPNDGKLSGELFRTRTVTIANSIPLIRGARISPDTILTSTGELTVSGEGYDADGDTLRWLCYWTLDYNSRIADSSLTIKLKELNLKKGSHLTAELYAHDGDTVSNAYVLDIDVVNGAPILRTDSDSIPYQSGSINFQVPIIDPDNDALTYEILDAPYGIKVDRNTGVITGSIKESKPFSILVRATDSEGAYLDARFTITPPD